MLKVLSAIKQGLEIIGMNTFKLFGSICQASILSHENAHRHA